MRGLLLACGLLFTPLCGAAEEIPGTHDPALQAAALRWLSEEEPEAALWEIGEIAAGGNVAARVLANRIYYEALWLDYPGLDRAGRRALLPPDTEGNRRSFSPYFVDKGEVAALRALDALLRAETPETFIENADIALRAGLYHGVGRQISISLGKGAFSLRLLEYAEDAIPEGAGVRADMWLARIIADIYHAVLIESDPELAREEAEKGRAAPMTDVEWAAFLAALAEGRWTAIRALSWFEAL
ncbi:MAG: hypothetical protein AAFY59_19670, partial [Pseudomonadota bacterium]